MMKGLEKLVKSSTDMTVGNHRVEFIRGNVKDVEHTVRGFFYHNNCVCVANDTLKKFHLDSCGYSGYSSTTRTLNDYRKHFLSEGYKEF